MSTMNIGRLKIHGIKIHARHGCLTQEAKLAREFVVNVDIDYDLTGVVVSDDLADSVDYVDVIAIVKAEMAIPSKMIEHVGARLSDKISAMSDLINKVEIEIIKPSPPINGNEAVVSILM